MDGLFWVPYILYADFAHDCVEISLLHRHDLWPHIRPLLLHHCLQVLRLRRLQDLPIEEKTAPSKSVRPGLLEVAGRGPGDAGEAV